MDEVKGAVTEDAAETQEKTEHVEGTVSTPEEQKQVEQRASIGANVIYEVIRRRGEDELHRPATALFWSAIAAGLSIGFSFIAEALLDAYLPNSSWRPLVSKAGYSVGFLIVILGRQQLFTENTLTVILPLLLRTTWRQFVLVLRLWSIVLAANLVGTLIFAFCISHSSVFDAPIQHALNEIARQHQGVPFWTVFLRGIFAGWLIALMVWLLPTAENSRLSVIVILTYIIGLGSLSHIIAGSTVMFYAVFKGMLGWKGYCVNFFVPTLAGNILGGVSLVAALAHGQVVGGQGEPGSSDYQQLSMLVPRK